MLSRRDLARRMVLPPPTPDTVELCHMCHQRQRRVAVGGNIFRPGYWLVTCIPKQWRPPTYFAHCRCGNRQNIMQSSAGLCAHEYTTTRPRKSARGHTYTTHFERAQHVAARLLGYACSRTTRTFCVAFQLSAAGNQTPFCSDRKLVGKLVSKCVTNEQEREAANWAHCNVRDLSSVPPARSN